MKPVIKLVGKFLIVFAFLAVCAPSMMAQANDATIDVPGVHIHADDVGASVIGEGVDIEAGQSEAAIGAPAGSSSTSYANARLPGFDFSNQNLSGANFANADVSGANFSGAVLSGANFSNAVLVNVNFTNALMTHARMMNTNLTGANLSGANLSQADLTNAVLSSAIAVNTRFDGAILVNVDMSQLIRQQPQPGRAALVSSSTIASALKIDQEHPSVPRKIDLTVNFDFNSDKLTPDGVKQVREIAAALKGMDLQKNHIRIEGHTDSIGGDAYNLDLSNRRAQCVLNILLDTYNIPSAFLVAQGFGKTRPIASNDNDLGRAMNRRVTLVNLGS